MRHRKRDTEVRKIVLERDGNQCRWPHDEDGTDCIGPMTVHHAIRRSVLEYRWEPDNLITLCNYANSVLAEADGRNWKLSPDEIGHGWMREGGWSWGSPGEWKRAHNVYSKSEISEQAKKET